MTCPCAPPHPGECPKLRVWYDDSNYVIAASVEDARTCLFEHFGGDVEDYADVRLVGYSDGKKLSIWCNEQGDPDEIDGDGCELVEKNCAEWAKSRGRGLLASGTADDPRPPARTGRKDQRPGEEGDDRCPMT